jgi:hypothetical protein
MRVLVELHAKGLASPHWVRRCFGVQSLGDIPHPDAVGHLVRALDDTDHRVVAFVLLELLIRDREVPTDASAALGRAVTKLIRGDPSNRVLLLALLAAERLPVAPEGYHPAWKRAFSRITDPHNQIELGNALINVIRARRDTELVDLLIGKTRRLSSAKGSKHVQLLAALFGDAPRKDVTWSQFWTRNRATYRFGSTVGTRFAATVDAYVESRRRELPPEHGTREYFEQFEAYFGELYAQGLDVVFVFDSTGSMQPLINEVKENIRMMTELLSSVTRETRVGLLTYRDTADFDSSYVTRYVAFTNRTAPLEKWIRGIQAGGGGDAPEAVLSAIEKTLSVYRWRQRVKRIITLIGDAPPHLEDRKPLLRRCGEAAADGYTINTIALAHDPETALTSSGTRPDPEVVALLAEGTRLTFAEIAEAGKGNAVVQREIDRVVADMLETAFGQDWQDEVDRFVEAYLLFSRSDVGINSRDGDPNSVRARVLRRLIGGK